MRLILLQEGNGSGQGVRLPVVVFSHGGTIIGLEVAEIIDIIDHRLDLNLAHAVPGCLGTTIVDGRLLEVIDVGSHFEEAATQLPDRSPAVRPRLLLAESSRFIQAMLEPLLRGAGYEVVLAATREEAVAAGANEDLFAAIVDFDGSAAEAAALCARLRASARAPLLVIGLATRALAGARLPAAAGHGAMVGKFDRRRLLDVLAADCALPAEQAA